MAKEFVIADLHFYHSNIIKYENRPFKDINEMNDRLIKNWNNTVSKQDTVYVLGDVSFAKKELTKKVIEKLNGHKVLILGNHDRSKNTNWWLDVGFDEVSKYPIIIKDFIVLQHEPPQYFNKCCPYFYIYGHVHSCSIYPTISSQSACVSVERWDYTPVRIDDILKMSNE